jgi:tol-pal system protein YbgF
VQAYRSAFAAWQRNDVDACIDQFRHFLNSYPSSIYADDGAYWMADCYFKKGDYKLAVMRFDDVVARYPHGNKAADALYRHGESLLKLGPSYTKAARRAFERVTEEYPDSPRAAEAQKQIVLLDGGGKTATSGSTSKPAGAKP